MKKDIKELVPRELYEVRYLIRRGDYADAWAPRCKTFNDYGKARVWAEKHCSIFVIQELNYDAGLGSYLGIDTISWGGADK